MKRGTAEFGSIPTEAISSPIAAEIIPFRTVRPERDDSTAKAKTIRAKYSAGPNRVAQPASTGASNTRPAMERVPPAKEAIAEMASAGPPLPRCVAAYPSTAVTTDEAVPGMFRRIVEMEFPYMEP